MNKNIVIAIVSLVLLAFALNPIFFAGDLSSYAAKSNELIAPTPEAQFSKQYFAYVQAHDLAAVKTFLDPKIVDAQFKEKFEQVANIFPNETAKSINFIGANTHVFGGTLKTPTQITVSSEYEFSNKWVLANIILQKQDNGFLVLGFNVQPASDSLEHLTRFTFWGQDAKHYIVFAAAILLLLFDIYALVLCIKAPIPKRKWLWIIFILIGFGKVEFNWMNGAFYYFGYYGGQNLTLDFFKFPVVGFSQMLYQPFIITMTLPLGAIIFLMKRKKWLVNKDQY